METGWIKLYREIKHSPVFKNPYIYKVWSWCLFSASSKPYDTVVGSQAIHLEPGQFVFGLLKAADELDIPKSSLHRYLKKLEDWECISIKPTNKYSIITIINWKRYQGNGKKVGNEKTPKALDIQGFQDVDAPTVGSKWEANGNKQEYKEVCIRKRCGEFGNVLLSDEEQSKLKARFPDDYEDRIERLSAYIESSGKRYKSHYATILSWARREAQTKQENLKGVEKIDW